MQVGRSRFNQRDIEIVVWSVVSALENGSASGDEQDRSSAAELARWIVQYGVGKVAAQAAERLAVQDIE